MIISGKQVLELNKKHMLLENLNESESNAWGAGIGMRIGAVYRLKGEGYIGSDGNQLPLKEKLVDAAEGDKVFDLMPGEFVIATTIEKLNLPAEKFVIEEGRAAARLMAEMSPRGSLQKCGIAFSAMRLDPGYSGQITFTLHNVGGCPFKVDLGIRIANLILSSVEAKE